MVRGASDVPASQQIWHRLQKGGELPFVTHRLTSRVCIGDCPAGIVGTKHKGKDQMKGTTLKVLSVLLAAGALAPLPAWTGESSDELSALETKLHGDWVGHGPCAGEITFRANGTYEERHVGPGGYSGAGDWDIRWDALPPTLVLSPKTSDAPGGPSKRCAMKILELDKGLVVDCGSKRTIRYERPEIDEARAIQISERISPPERIGQIGPSTRRNVWNGVGRSSFGGSRKLQADIG